MRKPEESIRFKQLSVVYRKKMPEATALDVVLGKVHQYILSVVPHPVVRTTLSLCGITH